ncbi:hypothetical protein HaLaN_07123, partial [Haematococcus lacustris]
FKLPARVEQQTHTHECTHVRQGGRAIGDTLDHRGQGLMSTSFGLAKEASSILNDTSAVDKVVHPVSTGSTSVAASPAAVKDGGGFGFEAEVQKGAPPTQGSIVAPAARSDDAKESSFQGFPSAPLPKAQHLGGQEASSLGGGIRVPSQAPGDAQPFGGMQLWARSCTADAFSSGRVDGGPMHTVQHVGVASTWATMHGHNGWAHTTVPQQAAAAGPWVACLAAACTPSQGTPCPWLAELPGLARSTAPAAATCSPQCAACSMLHCSPCPATCLAAVLAWLWQPCPWPCLCPWWAQLPACCAWLEGEKNTALQLTGKGSSLTSAGQACVCRLTAEPGGGQSAVEAQQPRVYFATTSTQRAAASRPTSGPGGGYVKDTLLSQVRGCWVVCSMVGRLHVGLLLSVPTSLFLVQLTSSACLSGT